MGFFGSGDDRHGWGGFWYGLVLGQMMGEEPSGGHEPASRGTLGCLKWLLVVALAIAFYAILAYG